MHLCSTLSLSSLLFSLLFAPLSLVNKRNKVETKQRMIGGTRTIVT